MTRIKLVWRLFPAFIVIGLICLVAGTWYTASSWRTFYLGQTAGDLENRARLVEIYLQDVRPVPDEREVNAICRRLGELTATRLTVILASGKVAGDSQEDPGRMDNHADRPEFREAMQGKVGVSTRFSFTLGHNMMYVAVPWRQKDQPIGVVRASLPMQALEGAIRALYVKVAWGGLGAALLVAAMRLRFSQERINHGKQGSGDRHRGVHRLRQLRGGLSRRVPPQRVFGAF